MRNATARGGVGGRFTRDAREVRGKQVEYEKIDSSMRTADGDVVQGPYIIDSLVSYPTIAIFFNCMRQCFWIRDRSFSG